MECDLYSARRDSKKIGLLWPLCISLLWWWYDSTDGMQSQTNLEINVILVLGVTRNTVAFCCTASSLQRYGAASISLPLAVLFTAKIKIFFLLLALRFSWDLLTVRWVGSYITNVLYQYTPKISKYNLPIIAHFFFVLFQLWLLKILPHLLPANILILAAKYILSHSFSCEIILLLLLYQIHISILLSNHYFIFNNPTKRFVLTYR